MHENKPWVRIARGGGLRFNTGLNRISVEMQKASVAGPKFLIIIYHVGSGRDFAVGDRAHSRLYEW